MSPARLPPLPLAQAAQPTRQRGDAAGRADAGKEPLVGDKIRIKTSTTLKHRANIGEEAEGVEFDAGAELQILQKWANAWLAKDDDGRLFNVSKSVAEEA